MAGGQQSNIRRSPRSGNDKRPRRKDSNLDGLVVTARMAPGRTEQELSCSGIFKLISDMSKVSGLLERPIHLF